MYSFAALTDLIDGYVARGLLATSHFGAVVDLVGDKALTMASLLFAASTGVDIRPLVVIAVREIVVLGARIVRVRDTPLLPTSRVFGGLMAAFLWGTTLALILIQQPNRSLELAYWFASLVFGLNLSVRLFRGRRLLIDALRGAR